MSDNITAAAARVRAVQELGGEAAAIHAVYEPWRVEAQITDMYAWGNYRTALDYYLHDLGVLADAYIAEHAADDDEPITEEWAAEIRKSFPSEKCWLESRHGWRLILSLNGINIDLSADVTTRGQVRALLQAMGVER